MDPRILQAFPISAQQELDQWWVREQIFECNCLADQLRMCLGEADDREGWSSANERVDGILDAATVNRRVVEEHLPGLLASQDQTEPGDSFGALVFLLALGDHRAVKRLLRTLSATEEAGLRATGRADVLAVLDRG